MTRTVFTMAQVIQPSAISADKLDRYRGHLVAASAKG
jgi:hypothetical protein